MTGVVLTTFVTSSFICVTSDSGSRSAGSFIVIVIIYSRGGQTKEVCLLASAHRQDRPNDHSGLSASTLAAADPGRRDMSRVVYKALYNQRAYRNRASRQGLVRAALQQTRPRIETCPLR